MPDDQGSNITHPPAPVTPTQTDTPTLSSASPETPTKRTTPHIVQTPKMKGYSRIGVGVGVGVGTRPSSIPTQTKPDGEGVEEDNEGLGYGIELDQYDLREIGMDRGEGSSSSSATREVVLEEAPNQSVDTQRNTPPLPAEVDSEVSMPDATELQRMSNRLAATDNPADRDELAIMLRSLLVPCTEQLPFLQQQLEAQQATIRTMQEHTRLAAKLSTIERDRHSAERAGWHREMRALLRSQEAEIAAGKRPRKGLDLDVGYHQELEASNKRLEMDNRLMAPRLADTQKQIDKLVTELRHLRSNVVLSTSAVQPSASASAPRNPLEPVDGSRRIPGSPPKSTFCGTTMGDARTEHLLLAARKVRTMRAHDASVGMMTLEELKRHGVVGPAGGVGYAEGYGGIQELSSEDEFSEEDEDRKPVIGSSPRRPSISKGGGGKKSQSVTNTPLLPRAKKSGKKTLPPAPTTPRGKNSQPAGPPPTTTPGGSNFNDLLRAAELATRPHTPSRTNTGPHVPMSAMSATRTRMREESGSERGSPVKKARTIPGSAETGDRLAFPIEGANAADQDASALDILAQASQLDVAQGDTPTPETAVDLDPSKPTAASHPSSVGKASSSSTLEPAIDLHPSSTPRTEPRVLDPTPTQAQPLATPQARPRNLSNASELQTPAQRLLYPPESPGPFDDPHQHGLYPPATDPPPGAFASPTGATVPGLGKYVHLSSSMPARRVRSPYLKWTVEEDELLARAVAMHGEKWDLVSKGVPTRSYHQVRQRWLRKTGAFDKKQSGPTTPADHHGVSGLGYEDDREGSPTPQSGRNKVRKEQQ